MEQGRMIKLTQQVAILKRFVKDRIGEGCWGLTKGSYEKLTHEEILFLFARIYNKIGFDSIESISTTYPDVVAIKDGKEKKIELEPKLSDFKHHIDVHDLSGCDYVVCWNDDLESFDELRKILEENKIQVEELEKYYEMTKTAKGRIIKSFVLKKEDIEKLSDNQMKILTVFIKSGKNILTNREIQDSWTEIFHEPSPKKGLGGMIHGLLGRKRRDWLLRMHPRGYQLNKKYKDMVGKVLKDFEYI